MSVITILFAILFLLMGVIGEEKGIKSFFALFANFLIIFLLLKIISTSSIPAVMTFLFCGVMSGITLFTLNGFHKKTISALISVFIVIIIMLIIISIFSSSLSIQGFTLIQSESIEYLSLNVDLPFHQLVLCEMLVGVFSAITDTAMTISSSINELYELSGNNATSKSLYKSGLNIGSDILGATVNTLFFVYFGNMLIVLIWFFNRKTSLGMIVNSKLFVPIIFNIIISAISVLLIIPVSAVISSKYLTYKKKQVL